jgi:phage-related protein
LLYSLQKRRKSGMPGTEVVIFVEDDGSCPLIEWMDTLSPKAQDKCIVRIERLQDMGNELRRPESDYLRDKIYELRAALQGIQYRILYFFHKKLVVISHGFTKTENKVPPGEIDLAIERMGKYEKDPIKHTLDE